MITRFCIMGRSFYILQTPDSRHLIPEPESGPSQTPDPGVLLASPSGQTCLSGSSKCSVNSAQPVPPSLHLKTRDLLPYQCTALHYSILSTEPLHAALRHTIALIYRAAHCSLLQASVWVHVHRHCTEDNGFIQTFQSYS